jgi:hypothetical protein
MYYVFCFRVTDGEQFLRMPIVHLDEARARMMAQYWCNGSKWRLVS